MMLLYKEGKSQDILVTRIYKGTNRVPREKRYRDPLASLGEMHLKDILDDKYNTNRERLYV